MRVTFTWEEISRAKASRGRGDMRSSVRSRLSGTTNQLAGSADIFRNSACCLMSGVTMTQGWNRVSSMAFNRARIVATGVSFSGNAISPCSRLRRNSGPMTKRQRGISLSRTVSYRAPIRSMSHRQRAWVSMATKKSMARSSSSCDTPLSDRILDNRRVRFSKVFDSANCSRGNRERAFGESESLRVNGW